MRPGSVQDRAVSRCNAASARIGDAGAGDTDRPSRRASCRPALEDGQQPFAGDEVEQLERRPGRAGIALLPFAHGRCGGVQIPSEYRLAEIQGFPQAPDIRGAERPYRRRWRAEGIELAQAGPYRETCAAISPTAMLMSTPKESAATSVTEGPRSIAMPRSSAGGQGLAAPRLPLSVPAGRQCICPYLPALKSWIASTISACEFITNGP